MANLRIIHNNAADRATLAASTTAGSLAAGNLLTDLNNMPRGFNKLRSCSVDMLAC